MCQQYDIIPIICHWCHWGATGVVDTSGNLLLVSTRPAVLVAKFAVGVVDTGGAPTLVNISANFRKTLR
jgi:hypothetical protein